MARQPPEDVVVKVGAEHHPYDARFVLFAHDVRTLAPEEIRDGPFDHIELGLREKIAKNEKTLFVKLLRLLFGQSHDRLPQS
jgi:hypothetical protein